MSAHDYSKIDPEFKAKWIAALRSGAYEQATGALRAGCGYCCLGVACELLEKGRWEGDADGYFYAVVDEYGFEDIQENFIPRILRDEIGLNHQTEIQLAQMNDENYTFEEIADKIEERL